MRCGWLLVWLVGAACTRQSAEPVQPAEPARRPAEASVPSQAEPPDRSLVNALRADAVYHDDIARRVLYTWTRAEQIAELERDRQLLTRRVSPTRGPSRFDRTLVELDDAPARLLRSQRLSLRRFAWANPWGARLGFRNESYGDRLIRVQLRPDAIVAKLDRSRSEPWSFRDLDGQPVTRAEALAHPERIAAVYHVYRGDAAAAAPDAAAPDAAAPYREYVLCNESRIAHWEHASERLARELRDDIQLLEQVRAALAATARAHGSAGELANADFVARLPERWASERPPVTLLERYAATLAFANPRYHPQNLDRLVAALKSTPLSEPLDHQPSQRFADQGKPAEPASAKPSSFGCGPGGTFPCARPTKPGSAPCGGTFGPCPAPAQMPCGGTFGPPCPTP